MDSSTTINPVISYIKTKMKRGTEEAMIKKITGMNPKASFGNRFRSKLRGIPPLRGIVQLTNSAALAEL